MRAVRSAAAKHEGRALAAILLAGLLVRLPFAFFNAHVSVDMGIFVEWARAIADHGLVAMTDNVHVVVYPPLSMLLIGAAGVVSASLSAALDVGNGLLVFLIKLPPIVADIGLAWLVARMLRGREPRVRLVSAALIAFNPAFFYLSAVWGQTDSVYVFFAVAALAALGRRAIETGWLAYGLAVASKVQPLLLAPVIVIGSLRARQPGRLATGVAIACLLLAALTIPWLAGGGAATYLGNLWGLTPRLDDSATNLWYLLRLGDTTQLALASQHPVGLPVPASAIAYAMLAAVAALVCGALWWHRAAVGLVLPAAILGMAPYMLLAGMRERYLLPALPFALLFAAGWEKVEQRPRGAWLAFLGVTLAQTVNLLAIAPPDRSLWSGLFLDQTAGPLARPIELLSLAAAAVNTLVFAWLLTALLRRVAADRLRGARGLPSPT